VKFVALDVVVLWDHTTLGSSSAHFPLAIIHVRFFLIPVKMMPLALSTTLLDSGWYVEAKHNIVPKPKQNHLKYVLSNCLFYPLLLRRELQTCTQLRTCVVRGPVDGRFLVWWVNDNVVWTDSWLSIAV
jgi:hypothetical protein